MQEEQRDEASPPGDSSPVSQAIPAAGKRPRTLPHLPALDGLRGVALAGVLLFHTRGALPGGYLGVELFFVLSGYLITALLLAEQSSTGRIDLKRFWTRRARRLMPALLAFLVAIAGYAAWVARRADLDALRSDALATLAYVANWRAVWANKSYWALFAAPSPLEHTWSLAIEEQFYVFWPLIVMVALRWRGRRALWAVSLGLASLSVVAMFLVYDPANTAHAYMGTDTRAIGLLMGAMLAMALPPGTSLPTRTQRAVNWLAIAGAAVLALAWWKLEGQAPLLYRGGLYGTDLAALAVIAAAATSHRGLIARILTWAPLRGLGTLSYGAYLWHWPAFVLLSPERLPWHPVALIAAQYAATFAISIVSYYFLEKPIRTRGVPFGRPMIVVPAAFAAVTLLLVLTTSPPAAKKGATTIASMATPGRPIYRLLLVGDSTANALGWTIRVAQVPGTNVELRGKDGLNLVNESELETPWSAAVKELHPHVCVVVVNGAYLYGFPEGGEWRRACYPKWNERFEAGLQRRLADVTTESVPVWVTTTPYPLGSYDNESFRAQADCVNASIRRVVASVPKARLLDLANLECPGGKCQRTSSKGTIRPDGVHYDAEAAYPIVESVLRELDAPVEAAKRVEGSPATDLVRKN